MRKKIQTLTIFSLLISFLGGEIFDFHKVFAAGSATVNATIKITVCGNNIKEAGEQCDGTDLGGASCVSQGFSGGMLMCRPSCEFDATNCTTGNGGGGGGGNSAGGGGGGGGGGVSSYVPPQTTVNFSGRAYPGSTVTLLKDAQLVVTTDAGPDANFQINLSGLSGGSYIFSVYSEDDKGNRSSLLTFPISVTQGAATSISGIFIAPTIAVDKSEVKRGDTIAIFGQSVPQADIIISVGSSQEVFANTKSDKNGIYLHDFDTAVLDYGDHIAKAKAGAADQLISGFSAAVGFKVSEQNVAKEVTQKTAQEKKVDVDGDAKVNLVDFSIEAYWYKRASPPASVDLNGDGKVDLVDFSIMAYYWTG